MVLPILIDVSVTPTVWALATAVIITMAAVLAKSVRKRIKDSPFGW
jgi:hypothetical protein